MGKKKAGISPSRDTVRRSLGSVDISIAHPNQAICFADVECGCAGKSALEERRRLTRLTSSSPTYIRVQILLTVRFTLQREDTEKIGELRYFPPNGTFNLMYYPFYGKKAQVNSVCNPD